MFELIFGGLALAALTTLELFCFGVFMVAMVVGTTYDRRGNGKIKWYSLLAGLVVITGLVVYNHGLEGLTWDNTVALLTSWAMWKPVCWYVGFGVVYSGLEFMLALRRSVRRHGEAWTSFLARTPGSNHAEHRTNGALLAAAKSADATDAVKRDATYAIQSFANEDRDPLFTLKSKDLAIDTSVNRRSLTDHVAAWTTLWPAYGLSLVFGDLLAEAWRLLADFMVSISGRLVRRVYADTFKVGA